MEFDVAAMKSSPRKYLSSWTETQLRDLVAHLQKTEQESAQQFLPVVLEMLSAFENRRQSVHREALERLHSEPVAYCRTLNADQLIQLWSLVQWKNGARLADIFMLDALWDAVVAKVAADPASVIEKFELPDLIYFYRTMKQRMSTPQRVPVTVHPAIIAYLEKQCFEKSAGDTVKWMHRLKEPEPWRPLSEEISQWLDYCYTTSAFLTEINGSHPVFGSWSADLEAMKFNAFGVFTNHQLRRNGAPPFRLHRVMPHCSYGSGVRPHTQLVQSSSPISFVNLPKNVVVDILTKILSPAPCPCHAYSALFNLREVIYSLCTLELTCRFFHTPVSDFANRTITEEAARLISLQLKLHKGGVHDYKYELFHSAKEQERELKENLYDRLYDGRRRNKTIESIILSGFGAIEPALCRPTCFLGDGIVETITGSRSVGDIRIGDSVRTEKGYRRVVCVKTTPVTGPTKLVYINGLGLTPSHPIFVPSGLRPKDDPKSIQPVTIDYSLVKNIPCQCEWIHPWELSKATIVSDADFLYNFELEGGPNAYDHSIWINGLLLATLGKDVGDRLNNKWPELDKQYGKGYWMSLKKKWEEST